VGVAPNPAVRVACSLLGFPHSMGTCCMRLHTGCAQSCVIVQERWAWVLGCRAAARWGWMVQQQAGAGMWPSRGQKVTLALLEGEIFLEGRPSHAVLALSCLGGDLLMQHVDLAEALSLSVEHQREPRLLCDTCAVARRESLVVVRWPYSLIMELKFPKELGMLPLSWLLERPRSRDGGVKEQGDSPNTGRGRDGNTGTLNKGMPHQGLHEARKSASRFSLEMSPLRCSE